MINTPFVHNDSEILQALCLKNYEMLESNYKQCPDELMAINFEIGEVAIQSARSNTLGNLTARAKEGLLNCFVDAAEEQILTRRRFGEEGKPLMWSGRVMKTSDLWHKKKVTIENIKEFAQSSIMQLIGLSLGLVQENSKLKGDELDEINEERLKKQLTKEGSDGDENLRNCDLDEGQIKLELAEIVLEQIMNETVEILEHINLSRKDPKLYGNKSIYKCNEIPRLDFQTSFSEDV